MATQVMISTISYNSEAFLKEKLDGLVKSHILQAYVYIRHKGEDGDKDHLHVAVYPNKRIDPMDLSDLLKEYDPNHPTKPLGVRPWRKTISEADWYLYAVHDSKYLELKYDGGEAKEKLPYEWTDIVSSDGFDVETAFIRAKATLRHSAGNLISQIKEGKHPSDLISAGASPFLVNAVFRALQTDDYTRLLAQYDALLSDYNALLDAIKAIGFNVVVADGNVMFVSSNGTIINNKGSAE